MALIWRAALPDFSVVHVVEAQLVLGSGADNLHSQESHSVGIHILWLVTLSTHLASCELTSFFHLPVRFTSNNFENGRGFQFGYKSTYVAPDMTYRIGECGGNFTTKNGLFTSPSFPDKYPNNEDCVWTISRNKGSLIRIVFMSMDVEMTNTDFWNMNVMK